VLALLIAVDGLEGGADDGAKRPSPLGTAGTEEAVSLSKAPSAATVLESLLEGEYVLRGVLVGGLVTLIGGVSKAGRGGTGGILLEGGGAPALLTARDGGGALGGGGVGEAAAEASPPFGFTHFLRSLS